jgi:ACS family pantothenate transporter-like MFS transporter
VWKTTDFPAARSGYLFSIIVEILLSKSPYCRKGWPSVSSRPISCTVLVTVAVQFLLWRDKKAAARAELETPSRDIESPALQESDIDEKRTVRGQDAKVVSLD